MRNFQIILLLLTFFFCSNLTAQSPVDKEGSVIKKEKVKPKKKQKPKVGVKAKMTFTDEKGNTVSSSLGTTPSKTVETKEELVSKIQQDPNTKYALATKIPTKEKTPSKINLVNLDIQIASLEQRIAAFENSDSEHKEAELEKLNLALLKKQRQKANIK